MRRQIYYLLSCQNSVEGDNGGLGCLPNLHGTGAATSSASRADLWNDSSTALPPRQKLVSCFLHVSGISVLKLNVFLD